jgi:hypothetical protein
MEEKKPSLKITQVAMFECAIYQNAVNIATALMQAGRFVNITSGGTGYIVWVYQRTNK